MKTFSGIWPALMTPANEDGSVNFAALDALVDYLLAKGADGFYVGGTTGEGIYLPVEARKQLVAAVLKRIDGRVPVIVHVGAIPSHDVVDMARHAQDHGADGVSSVLPPLYESPESLRLYYTAIGAAAPEIPLIAYLLNPRIDGVALMRSLEAIPNLGGAKYTGPNMFEMRQIIDLGNGRWSLFSGMDEQSAYALMSGASGCIGSTLNFMIGVYKAIDKAVKEGRYQDANALQLRANNITSVMIAAGFSGALKSVVGDLLNMEMGQPRLPAMPLSAEKRAALRTALAQTDFAEFAAL